MNPEKDPNVLEQNERDQNTNKHKSKYEPPDIEIVDVGEVALREYH